MELEKKILFPVSCDTKDLYHNVHIVTLYSEIYMVFKLFRICLNLLKHEQIFNAFDTHEILSISSCTKIPRAENNNPLTVHLSY